MTVASTRPSWVEVDLSAIRSNVAALAGWCAPAQLCAVVKADAYGHGAAAVARAALEGGASWLAVAVAEEGLELRDAGITTDVLVLSDVAPGAVAAAAAAGLALTVSSEEGVDAVAAEGGRASVHLKVDTGMHRAGCQPREAQRLARRIVGAGLVLEGLWTHLAAADEPGGDAITKEQLDVFGAAAGGILAAVEPPPTLLHAANSAGAIYHPNARYDLVRCGIALYGYAPSRERSLPGGLDLRPALSLKSIVTAVRDVRAGDGVSYGWVRRMEADCRVATIPLGYADGVPRLISDSGTCVLIRGRRQPLAGRITMDQLMVECSADVEVGDEVVLIGGQGDETITADDWAQSTGTISYEILARLGPRLPRRYV